MRRCKYRLAVAVDEARHVAKLTEQQRNATLMRDRVHDERVNVITQNNAIDQTMLRVNNAREIVNAKRQNVHRHYNSSKITHTHETTIRIIDIADYETNPDAEAMLIKHVNVYICAAQSDQSICAKHERIIAQIKKINNVKTIVYSVSSKKIKTTTIDRFNSELTQSVDDEYTRDQTLSKSQLRDYLAQRFSREHSSRILHEIALALSKNSELSESDIEIKRERVFISGSAESMKNKSDKRAISESKKAIIAAEKQERKIRKLAQKRNA